MCVTVPYVRVEMTPSSSQTVWLRPKSDT
jgi:hypothetical protein